MKNTNIEIQESIKLLSQSNKNFKHYQFIPSAKEFLAFHSRETDLFIPSSPPEVNRFKFTAKDIFNTNIYPTEMGSPIWKGFIAGNNARCITDALWAGDILVAKTVTSEFAVHEETQVINPWDQDRTVGTSSAGAPISVLIDGIDYALATQTAGSIGRPASYTGTLALKPTFGLIPRTGVLKTCDPFDTIGFFTKNLSIMSKALDTLSKFGPNYPANKKPLHLESISINDFRAVFVEPSFLEVSNEAYKKLEDIKSFISSSHIKNCWLRLPSFLSNVHQIHEEVYSYSLSYYFANELQELDNVSNSFKETVELGAKVSPDNFSSHLKEHSSIKELYFNWMSENNIDFIITPTTEDVAPIKHLDEPKDINLIYTFLGVPVIYIPLGFNHSLGLPFGICISSYKFNDYQLIKFAEMILENFIINEGANPQF